MRYRRFTKVFPLFAGFVLMATSCTTKRTQVMVGVITNLTACDGLKKVTLEVFGGPNLDVPLGVNVNGVNQPAADYDLSGLNCAVQGGQRLPGSVAVAADDNNRALVQITGVGIDGGPIVRRSVVSLIKEKVLFMRMALVDECKNVTCPGTGQTCIEGICRPQPVGVGTSSSMGTMMAPITIAGGDTIAANHGGYHAERLLPEYVSGMEKDIDCVSAQVNTSGEGPGIKPYRNSDPNDETALVPKGTCAEGFFCEEGTCYQYPPVPDAGIIDPPFDGGVDAPTDGQAHDAPVDAPADAPLDGQLADGPTVDGAVIDGPLMTFNWQGITIQANDIDGGLVPLGGFPSGNQAAQVPAVEGQLLWGGVGGQQPPATYRWTVAAPTSSVSTFSSGVGTYNRVPLPPTGTTAWDQSRQTLVTYRTARDPERILLHWIVEYGEGWSVPFPEQLTQAAPGGSTPAPREDTRIAYDRARSAVVMFGGACVGCCEGTECCASGALCDTWIWRSNPQDPGPASWYSTAAKTRPPGRRRGELAYHGGFGRLILFGGVDVEGKPVAADTWAWDGSDWTKLEVTFSGTVGNGLLLEDPSAENPRVLWVTYPNGSQAGSEVWALEQVTGWRRLRAFASTPAIQDFSAVYDPDTKSVFVMGGEDASHAPTNQVWQLQLP